MRSEPVAEYNDFAFLNIGNQRFPRTIKTTATSGVYYFPVRRGASGEWLVCECFVINAGCFLRYQRPLVVGCEVETSRPSYTSVTNVRRLLSGEFTLFPLLWFSRVARAALKRQPAISGSWIRAYRYLFRY